jgi:cytochrome b561
MSATRFNGLARVLHWTMSVLIFAMLFIGVAMTTSLTARPWLIELHRPLGIALLLLAAVRLVNRRRNPPPPLPSDLPAAQAVAARASHGLLYALMIGMPLLGWATASASGMPVHLFGGLNLPAIAPHDPVVYGWLRSAHGAFGMLLFAVVLLHLAAALFHAWVRRDGVFRSMSG